MNTVTLRVMDLHFDQLMKMSVLLYTLFSTVGWLFFFVFFVLLFYDPMAQKASIISQVLGFSTSL